jgi:hypothetical protein
MTAARKMPVQTDDEKILLEAFDPEWVVQGANACTRIMDGDPPNHEAFEAFCGWLAQTFDHPEVIVRSKIHEACEVDLDFADLEPVTRARQLHRTLDRHGVSPLDFDTAEDMFGIFCRLGELRGIPL